MTNPAIKLVINKFVPPSSEFVEYEGKLYRWSCTQSKDGLYHVDLFSVSVASYDWPDQAE